MSPTETYPAPSADGASSADDPRVLQAVEEYLAALEAGQTPAREAFLSRHASIAARLGEYLDGLELIHRAGSAAGPAVDRDSADDLAGAEPLGDFLLVREIGRGGMGVVFEALQRSLNRRVALKVLPFAAALDARQLQRFQNEARAAAGLHHAHIVPVFGVGCERGVHYYAMQLIDGLTLAAVIEGLRHPQPEGAAATPAASTARALLSTERDGGRSRSFFRAVARLGIEAAEALEAAHQLGVVHRDVKPGNLLLDAAGALWVTDFGLARVGTQAGLTMSGDLVGTLRYMSPEQALGGRGVVDHRTDIYSLGATLYELLTLQPAVVGNDRQAILRQIAEEEPVRPRRLSRTIPAELETIVLKALEKNPTDRYATARELAEDLGRFLKDEPIRARRPTLMQRAAKWGRRHRGFVAATAVVLALALVLLGGVGGWLIQRRLTTEAEARQALAEADSWQQQRRWPEARAAAQRAEGLLTGGGGRAELRQRVRTLLDDLGMVERIQEVRLEQSRVKDDRFDIAAADAAYAQAFREYGLDVDASGPEAAAWIRTRSIAVELASALDDWALARRAVQKTNDGPWKQLLALARAADPDPLRTQVRLAVETKDQAGLTKLAQDVRADLPAATLHMMGRALRLQGAYAPAIALLREGQSRFPGDFWLNEDLAFSLVEGKPPQYPEAVRFYTAALALRPQSPGVHVNLGIALKGLGRWREAEAAFRKATELKPDYAMAHSNLGMALGAQGRLKESETACRQAIEANPAFAEAYDNLGIALKDQGRLDEAVAAHRKAIELNPTNGIHHYNLGVTLEVQGKTDEALAAYRKTVELKPDFAEAHVNLGAHFKDQGRLAEAEAAFRKAIEAEPGLAEAHCNLGLVLGQQERFADALVELRKGHELGSKNPRWPYPSGEWVRRTERFVKVAPKLPQILSGQAEPADAVERVDVAALCQEHKHRYATAARFFEEAFAQDAKLAEDLKAGYRYDAACCAALAGCGQGEDVGKLDDPARARLRRQALDWLKADLARWAKQAASEQRTERGLVQQKLGHWQKDPDLTGVRDPEALAKLPPAERTDWQALWHEVAALLKQAQR